MGHLSLYRAFRPTSFEQLVRQEHVVRILKNQIQSGAIGHAYLFCGPRGTGKTTVARILARAVNCEHPQNGSPCGECETCRALAEGGNLDVSEIDAASNNGVNEMRELRDKVQYPPVSGKYKVYIIDEVHMLTDSAFNALLKTLEEPPRHAIFILATTEPHKIPATILSRCMRLDFKLIPEEDLEAHLIRVLDEIGKPYEKEAVAAIARAGAGSDRDMLSIAEMCISYGDKLTYDGVTAVLGTADFGQMSKLCGAILQADLSSALSYCEGILSEGKSVGVLLRDILRFLNQATIVKTCKNADKLLALPKDAFENISAVVKNADGHAILRAMEIFSETETGLRLSTSPRISLETAIVKASTPQSDYNIDALISRITALEQELASLKAGGAVVKTTPVVQEKPIKSAVREVEQPRQSKDDGEFPTEEPFIPESYYAEETPFPKEVKREEKPAPIPQLAPVTATAEGLTAEVAFGKFMRILRTRFRNGVLFTMCSDLESEFVGSKLMLYTTSDTVCRSLNREDHVGVMKEAFALVGIADFEVKKRGDVVAQDTKKQGLDQLRENFSGYPVEVR